MLYIVLALTLVAGSLIHALAILLPTALHHSWAQECIDYLKSTHPSKAVDSILPTPQPIKIKRWHYLPFFSRRFLTLDIALFASSLLVFYHFDSAIYWGSALIFTWLLITSSFIDAEHQILPDELTYILLWAGLTCSCWNLYTSSTSAILGALVAYLSLLTISFLFKLIRKKEGIGQGDLKFFAAIATWTGILYLPLILFLASLFSIIFILLRKIIAKKPCSTPASFGPFLALSGGLVLLWGHEILFFIIH